MKTPRPEPRAGARATAPAGMRSLDFAPAGFWRRHAAWTLDAALLALPAWWLVRDGVRAALADCTAALNALAVAFVRAADAVLAGATPLAASTGMLADPAALQAIGALQLALLKVLALPALAFALLSLPWHAGFEASARQATPGQRAFALHVADADGSRIGVFRGVCRHLAGAVSWATLNIGHMLAAVPPQHLALHDRLSGTRVLMRSDARWPALGTIWLMAQAFALLAAFVWLFLRLQAAMHAALGL